MPSMSFRDYLNEVPQDNVKIISIDGVDGQLLYYCRDRGTFLTTTSLEIACNRCTLPCFRRIQRMREAVDRYFENVVIGGMRVNVT
jgi:hypothetical protein